MDFNTIRKIDRIVDELFDMITEDLRILDLPFSFEEIFFFLQQEYAFIYASAYNYVTDPIEGEDLWTIYDINEEEITYYISNPITSPLVRGTYTRQEMNQIIYNQMRRMLDLDLKIAGKNFLTDHFLEENSDKIKESAVYFVRKFLSGNAMFSQMRDLCRVENGNFYINGRIYPLAINPFNLEIIALKFLAESDINYSELNKNHREYLDKERRERFKESFKEIKIDTDEED